MSQIGQPLTAQALFYFRKPGGKDRFVKTSILCVTSMYFRFYCEEFLLPLNRSYHISVIFTRRTFDFDMVLENISVTLTVKKCLQPLKDAAACLVFQSCLIGK